MIKLFLFDIEGTTTDINFVHKVLFPYSNEHMESFVLAHTDHPVVAQAIAGVQRTVLLEQQSKLDLQGVIAQLKTWIKEDRKHPALKEIQGLIWDAGYTNNHFKGHVYPDVQPFFKRIVMSDFKIGIYSSGSVHAQKLIFGYSEAGDLTPFISYYFDTKVGGKREKESYLKIAHEIQLEPKEIHFFSDIPQELEAAQAAGFMVTHVCREGTATSSFLSVSNFQEMMERI
jgi:enolase-phosphatase E1